MGWKTYYVFFGPRPIVFLEAFPFRFRECISFLGCQIFFQVIHSFNFGISMVLKVTKSWRVQNQGQKLKTQNQTNKKEPTNKTPQGPTFQSTKIMIFFFHVDQSFAKTKSVKELKVIVLSLAFCQWDWGLDRALEFLMSSPCFLY